MSTATALHTIGELFTYNDWAWQRLLRLAEPLSEAQLDQPIAMGPGSLRATLNHLWAAERVWLDRWQRREQPPFRHEPGGVGLAQLRREHDELAQERNAFVAGIRPDAAAAPLTYTNTRGQTFTFPLIDLMLHVANHGVHHRAQAINMLRRLGGEVPKPGLDYIFMRLEMAGQPPPALSVDLLRRYLGYGDWANGRIAAAVGGLSDPQLDQPFEMGVGTLRQTLLHIRFAEQWWLENWTVGPDKPFPELEETTPLAEIVRLTRQTATARDAYLSRQSDADLTRIVQAKPRPGVVREFPLGVTALQICGHGTHHRAQALNMLRQFGVAAPELDYVVMLRED